MRFNLSLLKKRRFDFVIKVYDSFLNNIWVIACKEELLIILDDLYAELKGEGFQCYSYKDDWKSIEIFAKGVDSQELGKKIATELEAAGYRVQLVTAASEKDHEFSKGSAWGICQKILRKAAR